METEFKLFKEAFNSCIGNSFFTTEKILDSWYDVDLQCFYLVVDFLNIHEFEFLTDICRLYKFLFYVSSKENHLIVKIFN